MAGGDDPFVGPWDEAWAEFEKNASEDEMERVFYWLERFYKLSRDDQRRALEFFGRDIGGT